MRTGRISCTTRRLAAASLLCLAAGAGGCRSSSTNPRHRTSSSSRSIPREPIVSACMETRARRRWCSIGLRVRGSFRSGPIGGAAHVASALAVCSPASTLRITGSATTETSRWTRVTGSSPKGFGLAALYRRLRRLDRAGRKPRVGSRLRCLQRWPLAGTGRHPTVGRPIK